MLNLAVRGVEPLNHEIEFSFERQSTALEPSPPKPYIRDQFVGIWTFREDPAVM